MKKLFFLSIVVMATKLFAQASADIALIPQPVSLTVAKGYFTLPAKIIISTQHDNSPEVKNIIDQLSKRLTTRNRLLCNNRNHTNYFIVINKTIDNTLSVKKAINYQLHQMELIITC